MTMQKEINIRELKDNFVKMISNDWALLTAGTKDDFNTMTVSWGGIGELWNKDVCFVFVRQPYFGHYRKLPWKKICSTGRISVQQNQER